MSDYGHPEFPVPRPLRSGDDGDTGRSSASVAVWVAVILLILFSAVVVINRWGPHRDRRAWTRKDSWYAPPPDGFYGAEKPGTCHLDTDEYCEVPTAKMAAVCVNAS